MVCKIVLALLRASMVVTYYIKVFQTGADRHNGIFPLDGVQIVAMRELIHQEVLECVNEESSTEHRSLSRQVNRSSQP